jgi:hypothetical protein
MRALVSRIAADSDGGYVVFARSMRPFLAYIDRPPAGTYDRLLRAVSASTRFRLVYGNRDAAVYRFVG